MVENKRRHERKTVSIPIFMMKGSSSSAESGIDMTPLGMNVSDPFGAVIKNASEDGLCVRVEKKFEPDDQVDVKMVDDPILAGDDHVSECKAKVVWCNHIETDEKTTCYEIGLKIFRKKVLPILNWKTRDFGSVKCM